MFADVEFYGISGVTLGAQRLTDVENSVEIVDNSLLLPCARRFIVNRYRRLSMVMLSKNASVEHSFLIRAVSNHVENDPGIIRVMYSG